jgi:hypothetical protein
MQINKTTMERSMEILQNIKLELTYDPVIPILASTQRNLSQVIVETPAHQCSLQHYSQKPSFGNKPRVLHLLNGLRKCGIYTQ